MVYGTYIYVGASCFLLFFFYYFPYNIKIAEPRFRYGICKMIKNTQNIVELIPAQFSGYSLQIDGDREREREITR